MQVTTQPTTTLDKNPPSEFPMQFLGGITLRDMRSTHPVLTDKTVQYRQLAQEDTVRQNDRLDQFHYTDGTVVNAGPIDDDSVAATRPVKWNGLVIAEVFDTASIYEKYKRFSYNLFTGELAYDLFEKGHHKTKCTVTIPKNRVGDPETFVTAVAQADADPREILQLFESFFNADVSSEALTEVATSDVIRDILD